MRIDIWSATPVLAVLVGVLLLRLHRRGARDARLLCVAAFCVYLAAVAAVTIFPILIDRSLVHLLRLDATSIAGGLNLVPLKGINQGAYSSSQIAGNFLLGVPFGFGLPFVGARSSRRVLGWGLLFAFGLEGAQLALNLVYGFAFRVVDINDVVLNFLGVVGGLLIFLAICAPYRRLDAGHATGETSYLHEVLSAH